MSSPINHHWLPQFLINRWAGDDGCVNSFYRPRGNIVYRRKSSRSLGSLNNLYTIPWKKLPHKSYVETEIFTKYVDTPFSKMVSETLENGIETLSPTARRQFAQQIVMQWVRTGERFDRDVDQCAFPNFGWFVTAARGPNSELSDLSEEELVSYYDDNWNGAEKFNAVIAMMEFSISSQFTSDLLELEWMIVNVCDCGVEYVLGDRPIIIKRRGEKLASLVFPLSPSHVFFAVDDKFVKSDIDRVVLLPGYRNVFVIDVNRDQFKLSNRFVVSRDLGPNCGFVKIAEMYMGRP